jgi:hypothetical protein
VAHVSALLSRREAGVLIPAKAVRINGGFSRGGMFLGNLPWKQLQGRVYVLATVVVESVAEQTHAIWKNQNTIIQGNRI